MSLLDISDHMARVCDCGCVKFNLLRSGDIECDNCQQKQPNINWSEKMNPSYEPIEEFAAFNPETIEKGKSIIRSAIEKNQQCFWVDIVNEKTHLTEEELLEASRQMQRDKQIRLREDSFEHAMEYILIK